MSLHRIYFAPGMFGFGRIGAYDYFAHVEREIVAKVRARGHDAHTYVVDVLPTASIRKRAATFAELVARTCDDDRERGPIHLVGHSTGGLDARLVASPSAVLPIAPGSLDWLPRLASVTTVNTPHYGTPLASFFATLAGQRLLYTMSALTIAALTVGAPPMAAASALVVAIGGADRALGLELRALDRATDAILRVLDDAPRKEIRNFLDAIRKDQGSVVQLTPEAMDLFQAGIENRAGVRYQSTVSMAPPPSAMRYVRSLSSAWSAASATLFAAIWRITARVDERYPCAAKLDAAAQAAFTRGFGQLPDLRASDGVVPVHSQVWGDVVWAGYADHLDVLGHFKDDGSGTEHRDWLASGAEFTRAKFDQMTDAIVAGMFST
ncbi:MAG: hypothetical protein U0235_26680 [Polyangiaceae bacterium]